MDIEGLARRVTRRREQLGLGQAELARRARMSPAYINRLENGLVRNPKLTHLVTVARALDLSLEALIDDAPPVTDQSISDLAAQQPRAAGAVANLLRALQWAQPQDREFILEHLESLARRFGRG